MLHSTTKKVKPLSVYMYIQQPQWVHLFKNIICLIRGKSRLDAVRLDYNIIDEQWQHMD